MVIIITGEKNAGKSTFLEHWYDHSSKGFGFCSRKTYTDKGEFCGYNLVFFPGKEQLSFIRLVTAADHCDPDKIIKGRFAFSRMAIEAARLHIAAGAPSASTPIWIDEIGALELSGEGFDALFSHLLLNYENIRVIFRKTIVNELIDRYGLTAYRVISL